MSMDATLDDWLNDGEANQRNAELAQITEVRTVPAAAQRIVKLLHREDASIPDLIAAVSQDPAIANRLLRAANAAGAGQTSQVSDLQQAVVNLGRKELRSLVADTPVLIAGTAGHDLAVHFGLDSTAALDGRFAASVPMWPAFADTADALRSLAVRYELVILSNIDRDGFAASNRKLGVRFDAIYTAPLAQTEVQAHPVVALISAAAVHFIHLR